MTSTDPILNAAYAWYRKALRRVTDISLELHASSAVLVHQQFLLNILQVTLLGANPRPDLRGYLYSHSNTFRNLCASPGMEEEFWRDFFTWPPEGNLSNPGHWLFNIVV